MDEQSYQIIIDATKKRVEIYDVTQNTCIIRIFDQEQEEIPPHFNRMIYIVKTMIEIIHDNKPKAATEIIDLRNQADATIYSVEKTLRDAGDKVPTEIKTSVGEKIEAVKKVKDGNDESALRQSLDALQQEIQKIGAEMYKQEKATEKEVTEEPEIKEKGEGGTIKGEFEEGDGKK